jgi:hypothetical protein
LPCPPASPAHLRDCWASSPPRARPPSRAAGVDPPAASD